ncbi:hypothetical protein BHU72_03110 [Desulfuribacillus stibiiarsenatis]|uniref:UPF0122 protein BHU72_03110 n=1 Tax=Desulfuribacillus stibiiarsenatis TaxID=1390249 RepID=A0A1E5L6N6_9FIRM|nr:YlxM family DNA-binding protein [Desulfuribacillus stibiiarsenatis]OEH85786.1 hypothetical protein BHU72_03110 [Desulfuribacillus stibiiarsenatis]
MLEKTTRVNLLYDFYGSLLSDKQRDFFELYYHDDWSLGEISEKYEISRQGVYDNLRRSVRSLEEYEEKLGLYQEDLRKTAILETIEDCINQTGLDPSDKDKLIVLMKSLQMND